MDTSTSAGALKGYVPQWPLEQFNTSSLFPWTKKTGS
jgi:hypothetical protein